MRSYDEIMEQLHGRPRYSKKKDLDRITNLMAALGNVQKNLHFVHVAGTNGKGSVSALTASALQQAGFRVGLFTSPYLKEFEERIRVNGQLIPKEDLCRLAEQVFAVQQRLEDSGGDAANEFEITTAIGMLWFYEQGCDYVVLEVGLGGRLDATNVIDPPACCCVTSIGLDHILQLGDTIEQVAGEKAGIIKPGSKVVTPYNQDPIALRVLEERCKQVGAELVQTCTPSNVALKPEETAYRYGDLSVSIPLAGGHQVANSTIALELCRCLGLEDEIILSGFAKVFWPGRLQVLSKSPWMVLDCAHNPPGVAALEDALDTLYPDKPLTVVMAMMQDKDYAPCVHAIAKRAAHFVATTLDMPRALSSEDLARTAAEICQDTSARADVLQAIHLAQEKTSEDGLILICGSVYLAGEILRIADTPSYSDKI
ncbi:MAG: bifunctional folylpolyglutamate synthase/dihydrofolate synthase [Ruminococcaceae bacterium]|nr:bifunctional folylpolyglutamate synthase/dihydrofolate synthase [Oscillospiraceae bacterium]